MNIENKDYRGGKGASSEELENLRANLIIKRKDFKTIHGWSNYCRHLVKQLEQKGSLYNNQLKGEIAEIVLEQYLVEIQKILKHYGVDSVIIKNLGITWESEENDETYSAELDLCLVTPYRSYLFEVKSYTGAKTIVDECLLIGKSKMNIYEQSLTHLDFYEMLFDECRVKYVNGRKGMISPYKLVFFEFSSQIAEDKRTQKWKDIIPYVHADNILEWFSKEFDANQKKQWELKMVSTQFKKFDKNRDLILQYHLKRLKEKWK